MDAEGYPDEQELEKIAKWPFKDMHNCMEFIRERWNWGEDYCPKEDVEIGGRLVTRYTFITGGWSGNEDLILALTSNFMGNYYYIRWQRGGKHEFEIPIKPITT
jgi:hypothetical protein